MKTELVRRSARILALGTALLAASAPMSAVAPCPPQRVMASDWGTFEHFGQALALSGDVAVVSAWQHFHAPGVCCGAAYVFRHARGQWFFEQELLASDMTTDDAFGIKSVAVEGDVIMIGAPGHTHAGVGGGAVFVYQFNGSQWMQTHELLASDAAFGDALGYAVALDGSLAVIGAPNDDDLGISSGSAYVFHYDGHAWVQQQKLHASDGIANVGFGISVGIHGDTILIGSPGDSEVSASTGAVYVFRLNSKSSMWVQTQKILPPAPAIPTGFFGWAISMSSSGKGPLKAVISAYVASRAYVFRDDGTTWTLEQQLFHNPAFGGGQFGRSVCLDGDRAIVGAWATHVYDGASNGAAYTFRYNATSWKLDNTFVPATGGSMFYGDAVAISGTTALIGVPGEDGQAGAAYFIELAPAPADLNCDGVVNTLDLGILLVNWSIPPRAPGCAGDTPCLSDLNSDGLVNSLDLGILLSSWTLK